MNLDYLFFEYLPTLCIGEDIQDSEFLSNAREGVERIYNFEKCLKLLLKLLLTSKVMITLLRMSY